MRHRFPLLMHYHALVSEQRFPSPLSVLLLILLNRPPSRDSTDRRRIMWRFLFHSLFSTSYIYIFPVLFSFLFIPHFCVDVDIYVFWTRRRKIGRALLQIASGQQLLEQHGREGKQREGNHLALRWSVGDDDDVSRTTGAHEFPMQADRAEYSGTYRRQHVP